VGIEYLDLRIVDQSDARHLARRWRGMEIEQDRANVDHLGKAIGDSRNGRR